MFGEEKKRIKNRRNSDFSKMQILQKFEDLSFFIETLDLIISKNILMRTLFFPQKKRMKHNGN